MNEKKIPMRQCVGCREMRPKKELLRLVHQEDGSVLLDRTGRAAGRGAYLCPSAACLERAVKNHALEKSFGASVSRETYESLKSEMESK